MNSYSSNLQKLEIQRRQLEQLWQPTPAKRLREVSGQWLKTAGTWLVQTLTDGNQPRIWTQETKQGSRWYVHDPVNGTQQHFDTEAALRAWLEQRYNR